MPPTRRSSAPGAVSSAGAEALSCATSTARCRSDAVERAVQLARDEHVDADADDDERRAAIASAAATIERAPSERGTHRPSTKPTPRTVWISGGSPSLRRRYET